jgi:hypothetical protein
MRLKCPACLHNHDLSGPPDKGVFTCPDCQARFRTNGDLIDPVPYPAPVLSVHNGKRGLSPSPRSTHEIEARRIERDEERQERHEDRDFRREKRDITRERWDEHREDRQEVKERNAYAIVGLALNGCASLMVGSALLFAVSGQGAMKAYLFFTVTLGLPMGLTGLVFSIVGLFSRKVMREVGAIGLVLGVILVLLLIPLGIFVLGR